MTVRYDFAGAPALVHGGTSGIGRATVELLVASGARVAFTGRRDADIPGATFVRCDATTPADISRATELAGAIELAVNCAGVESRVADLADHTDAEWEGVLAANLTTARLAMRAQLPGMLARGRGAIVNVSSVWGLVGAPGVAPYVAAKHAVVGLTRAAALEVAGRGVRVNAVAPGHVDTEMLDRATGGDPAIKQAVARHHPSGRLVRADEVAAAIVWLCSSAASAVNGQVLAVDDGMSSS